MSTPGSTAPEETGDTVLLCRGLLFDSDGVLVDSDASVLTAWGRWATSYGLEPDEVIELVHGRRSADTVALLIPEDQRREALAAIDRFEIEDAAGVTALPGSLELLTALPPGAWAVVTSAVGALATARLTAAGLPHPEVLVTADDVGRGKPAPEGYRAAAARLGLVPEQCVVLEDSPAGVLAGTAAGAVVIGVTERALGTDVELVVRDLSGLRFEGGLMTIPAASVLRG